MSRSVIAGCIRFGWAALCRDQMIAAPQAWAILLGKGGQFFTVTFRLKNKAKDGRPAGTLRTMRARLHTHKYKNRNTGLGVFQIADADRWAEDFACNVLTCFDLDVFRQGRAAGLPTVEAGRRAYRRINLQTVISIVPIP